MVRGPLSNGLTVQLSLHYLPWREGKVKTYDMLIFMKSACQKQYIRMFKIQFLAQAKKFGF